MTDEQTTQETAEEPETTQTEAGEETSQPKSEGGQLRDKLEAEIEKRKALEDRLRKSAFKEAGFDPEKGHGKLLAQVYDGEPDADAIRQVAEEHELSPNLSAPQQRTEEEVNRQQAGQRTDQVMGSSQPSDELSIEDQITQAEQSGDQATATALKMELLNQQHYPQLQQ